jgi:hypothetical protein
MMALVSLMISVGVSVRPVYAQSCVPVPVGLVSWWPAEGNATDVVSGNNGTLIGNVTYGVGEVGGAFQLDGASYISVAPTSSLVPQTAVSVDAWIKPSPSTSYFPPIVKNSGAVDSVNGGYSLEFDFSGTSIAFWVFAGGLWSNSGFATVPVDTWTHVAGTYDGQFVSLYVNGVLTGTSYAPGTIAPATLGLNIGHDPSAAQGSGDRFFTGAIDEPDVFSRALTAAEIQAIYAAGPGGKCQVSATEKVQQLITSTLVTNLAANIQNQLDAKLSSALATLDAAQKNSANTAANQLQAFVNNVVADLYAGKLVCGQALPLIGAAQQIATALHQPALAVSPPCP